MATFGQFAIRCYMRILGKHIRPAMRFLSPECRQRSHPLVAVRNFVCAGTHPPLSSKRLCWPTGPEDAHSPIPLSERPVALRRSLEHCVCRTHAAAFAVLQSVPCGACESGVGSCRFLWRRILGLSNVKNTTVSQIFPRSLSGAFACKNSPTGLGMPIWVLTLRPSLLEGDMG